MRIGVDFDNTIAGYDHLFAPAGIAMGWLPAGFTGSKPAVRAHLRGQDGGEELWTRLQAEIYGPRMAEAQPVEEVLEVLTACRRAGHHIVIVSHKTRFAAADPQCRHDLRQGALDWMAARGFFTAEGLGLGLDSVHFEDSRAEKCRRIALLGLDCFIDDLEEVFRDPAYPAQVAALLLHRLPDPAPPGPYRCFSSWSAIAHDLLGRS